MVALRSKWTRSLIVALILCIIALDTASGRGGGRGGGSRGGRGKGGKGGRGGGTEKWRSGWKSGMGKSTRGAALKVAVARGIVKLGVASVDYNDKNNDVVVCRNVFDYRRRNGTKYEYFICPQTDDDPDEYVGCCGDDNNRQHCCELSAGWVISSIVLWGSFAFAGVSLCCWLWKYGCKAGYNLCGICKLCCDDRERSKDPEGGAPLRSKDPEGGAPLRTKDPEGGAPLRTKAYDPAP